MNDRTHSEGIRGLTLAALAERIRAGEIRSREATDAYLDAIAAEDAELGCYLAVTADAAHARADAADARLAKGAGAPLEGVPIALKDIFCTKGIPTTCASRILERYLPPYDATATARLAESGTVLLGKLNMDEFAMGSSNEFSAFHPVRNPWNRAYTPGGSSGGAAAAVAAGLAPAALGTDTGGSVRQPAALCGVVGMKPTYGRVSRYGIVAYASSLDQVGPITRDVTDCALLLRAIAGRDERDATSAPVPVPDYAAGLTGSVKGLRIGLPKEYFVEGIDPEVEEAVRAASTVLEQAGATIEEVSLPHTRYAVPCYYIIAPAECSANLARYDGIRYGHRDPKAADLFDLYTRDRTQGFGPEVTLRIIVGTYVLSAGYYDAYYRKAQKVRTLIKRDFLEAFERCDALLAPVTPTPAFKLGEKIDDPIKMYLNDIFTIPVNLAGLPGLSIPCGVSKTNLPIGLQLIGKPFDEGTILNVGYAYEQATEWTTRIPVKP